ncbi:MAG: hypothetical protein P8179_03695 [Candidatus Thiodiazotropha sp.]
MSRVLAIGTAYSYNAVMAMLIFHNQRSYFLQNQISVIRMERPTDFFRLNKKRQRDRLPDGGRYPSPT